MQNMSSISQTSRFPAFALHDLYIPKSKQGFYSHCTVQTSWSLTISYCNHYNEFGLVICSVAWFVQTCEPDHAANTTVAHDLQL